MLIQDIFGYTIQDHFAIHFLSTFIQKYIRILTTSPLSASYNTCTLHIRGSVLRTRLSCKIFQCNARSPIVPVLLRFYNMKHCFIISLSRACLFQNRTTAPWAAWADCLYNCPLSKAESSSDSCRTSSSTHTDQFASAIPCLPGSSI